MIPERALTHIGIVHSIFKKKFGIPRQPGIVSEASATIELLPPFNNEQFVRGLEGFSHIWVLFVFHASADEGWHSTVRPPRLGGKKRVGVFASRSPFRPNPIGLSAVELEEISFGKGKVFLHIKGVDILDGTPVIDIKPYLSYSDSIADASSGYAASAPERPFDVVFSDEADLRILKEKENGHDRLRELIIDILSQDPRPAYYTSKHRRANFSISILDFEINWRVEDEAVLVTEVNDLK